MHSKHQFFSSTSNNMYFTIITVTDLGVAPERSPIGAVVVILLSRCSSAYFVAAFKKNLYYSMRDVSRFFQPQDEDETTNFRSYCSSQGDRLFGRTHAEDIPHCTAPLSFFTSLRRRLRVVSDDERERKHVAGRESQSFRHGTARDGIPCRSFQ